jgi:hypothetical protein
MTDQPCSSIADPHVGGSSLALPGRAYSNRMSQIRTPPGEPSELERIALYSLRGIGVGTFVGGPLAAGILAGMNFHKLGRKRAGHLALAIGALVAVFLFGGMFMLPPEIVDRVPNALLPAIYVSIAVLWVQKTQGAQIAAALDSGAARKASGWSIAGISLGSLAVSLGVVVPFALAEPPFGFGGERATYGPEGMHDIYVVGDIDRSSVDELFETLDDWGFVSSDFGAAFQIKRIDEQYELAIPILRTYWDDAELLAELARLRDALGASVFHATVTILLVDEDFKGTHRKEL